MAGGTWDGSATSFGTRQIVIAGVLGGIAIFLGATRFGFIPVPNIAGNATIMHIPAIVGGALEGPVVGLLAGAIFGVFSFVSPDSPIFAYPQIAILPRLLIGIAAWAVFVALRGVSVDLAAAVSGVLGSLTNTIGVLGIARFMDLLTTEQIITIVPQAIAEAVIAAIVTVVVVRGVLLYRSGRTTAPEISSDEEKRY